MLIPFAIPPASAETLMFGVEHLTFSWDESTGTPFGYVVWVSTNGAAPKAVQIVPGPQVTIPVELLDTTTVGTMALGFSRESVLRLTLSAPSETVRVLPAPGWSPDALFALHCASCNELQLRPNLSPPEEVPALPPPWRIVGIGSMLQAPEVDVLWQNDTTGDLRVIGLGAPLDPPLLTSTSIGLNRALGLAELDGDPTPEILVQSPGGQQVEVWEIVAGELVPVGSVPGVRYWSFVDAEDVDGDGVSELWWRPTGRTPGQAQAWKVDPATGNVNVLWSIASGPGQLVEVADVDGDGTPDAIWRDALGQLTIMYFAPPLPGEPLVPNSSVQLEHFAGDENWNVRGAVDVDGYPGAEILVQHKQSYRVDLRREPRGSWNGRITLFDVERRFKLVHSR